MLGMFVLGLIGVIALIIIGLLTLFIVPFIVVLIPVVFVGGIMWVVSSIHWLAGLAWFIIIGALSLLQTLWHVLF